MTRTTLPEPTMTLSRSHARRFLLAHQHLWPPHQLQEPDGVLAFIRHVGCIQFDPLNIVGRNPDLVLQSRVANYTPTLLDTLLYTDRQLLDVVLSVIGLRAPADARLMWIQNTLRIAEVECSEAYYDQARGRSDLEILTRPRALPLNDQGNLPLISALGNVGHERPVVNTD